MCKVNHSVYAEPRGMSERELMRYRPTKIGQVSHYVFYEDPELGDEAPLLVVNVGTGLPGSVWVSHFWELPSFEEVM